MRTLLLAIFILLLITGIGLFGFKFWQSKANQGNREINLEQSLTGILQPISSVGEYSDIIVDGGKTVGVTSNTVNLKPYENKKVKILGQYSGTTMYADSVTILP